MKLYTTSTLYQKKGELWLSSWCVEADSVEEAKAKALVAVEEKNPGANWYKADACEIPTHAMECVLQEQSS